MHSRRQGHAREREKASVPRTHFQVAFARTRSRASLGSAVNGYSTQGASLEQVKAQMVGQPGTQCPIAFQRPQMQEAPADLRALQSEGGLLGPAPGPTPPPVMQAPVAPPKQMQAGKNFPPPDSACCAFAPCSLCPLRAVRETSFRERHQTASRVQQQQVHQPIQTWQPARAHVVRGGEDSPSGAFHPFHRHPRKRTLFE